MALEDRDNVTFGVREVFSKVQVDAKAGETATDDDNTHDES